MCYVWGEEFRRQEEEDEEERNVSGQSYNNNVPRNYFVLVSGPGERTLDVFELLRMRNSSVLMSLMSL
jgi:hypothetical protein